MTDSHKTHPLQQARLHIGAGLVHLFHALGAIRSELVQEYQLFPAAARQLRRPDVHRNVIMDVMLMFLISIAMAGFCISRDGGLDLYMSAFLPMLGVTTVFFLFTEAFHSSRSICLAVTFLILTGVAIQIILMLSAGYSEDLSADKLVLFAVVSILFALAVLPILIYLSGSHPKRSNVIIFLNIATVLLYLALLVFGRTVNSTRAWIVVGSFQFQMTEPIKVVSLITLALCFRNEDKPYDKRLLSALITLAINGCFLLVINELGTLCVLGITFFCLGLFYQPSVRKLLGIVALLFAAAALVLMICGKCYDIKNPPVEETTIETTVETIQESVEATEAPAETDEEPSMADKVVSLGAKIYNKFKLRFDLLLDPDSVDPNNGGYQNRKAQESLILSNWFGSAVEVYIPVAESDYVFCYLILKMGVCFGITVLALMILILFQGIIGGMANTTGAEGAVAVAFVLAMVIQSLLAAASATGYFITIGLPFAFLADGGSAILTNYTMVIFILYATRQITLRCHQAMAAQAPIHRKER